MNIESLYKEGFPFSLLLEQRNPKTEKMAKSKSKVYGPLEAWVSWQWDRITRQRAVKIEVWTRSQPMVAFCVAYSEVFLSFSTNETGIKPPATSYPKPK